MLEFFKSQMDYIYFIYGMSFFILSGSALLLLKTKKQKLPWLSLVLFGLIHALNEWLDLAAVSIADNPEFKLLRFLVLTISFVFLVDFFLSSLKVRSLKFWFFVLCLGVVCAGWYFTGLAGLNFTARYFLGFPGGLGSGVVLILSSFKTPKPQKKYLCFAGIVFGLYSLTQLVITNPPAFLTNTLLNQEHFLNFFKFPISLLRCILGSWLAFLLFNFWTFSQENQIRHADSIKSNYKIFPIVSVYLVLIVIGWLITQAVYSYQHKESVKEFLIQANTAAGPINFRRVESLSASLADVTSPDFIRLKEELEAFNKANEDIKYVYLIRFRDNKIVFLVDATAPDLADYSPPGQIYGEAKQELKNKFFSGESFIMGPYTDRWGTWFSAFAPIFDKETKTVIALIGLDIDTKVWQREMFYHRLLGILASFALIIFFVSLYIINRINYVTNQAVHISQKELEVIFNSARVWIFYKDKENRFIRVNKAFADSMNMAKEELEGKLLADIYSPEIAEVFRKDDAEVILSGKPKINIIESIDTKKGRLWVQTDKFPYVDEQGKIIGVVGFAMDITEQRKLEKAIWDSEDRYRTLVSNVPGAIYRCKNDTDGSMVFISYAIRDITGYPARDFIENKVRTYKSIIYAADRQMVQDTLESAIAKNESYQIEYRIVHSDGSLRWVNEWGQGVFGEGSLIWLDGVIFDFTEHKKILEDLRYASAEWQRTFDSMSDLVFILDKDFTILKANKVCLETLKLKPEEMIGKKCHEVVHHKDSAWPNCSFDQTRMDKKIHTEEVNEPRLGVTLLVTTSPIFNDIGEFVGAIHIAKDITQIKKYQYELEKKNKDLEKLDQLKSEFVSVVSHELRTPLSIIKEGVCLVLDRILGEINLKQEKILKISKDNIDRLTRIINNLLDISKIESGKVELNKKFIGIISLVRKVADNFDSKAKERGLELKLSLPSTEIEVLMDEDRIVEVLTNLIGNAFKFTKAGFVHIEVMDRGQEIQCGVTDSGIGVRKENLERLFSKFTQIDRTDSGGEKGTGLGLSIAKGLVELHGGKIWAESEFGQGMRVYFTLPKHF